MSTPGPRAHCTGVSDTAFAVIIRLTTRHSSRQSGFSIHEGACIWSPRPIAMHNVVVTMAMYNIAYKTRGGFDS